MSQNAFFLKTKPVLLCCSIALTLTAYGGSGSDDPAAPQPQPPATPQNPSTPPSQDNPPKNNQPDTPTPEPPKNNGNNSGNNNPGGAPAPVPVAVLAAVVPLLLRKTRNLALHSVSKLVPP